MPADLWKIRIEGVLINARHPATVEVAITPTDKVLIDKHGTIARDALIASYREAIERGDWTLFRFVPDACDHDTNDDGICGSCGNRTVASA